MSLTLAVLTLVGVAVLAFANGANDVSKGVATLAGSGRASYRTAIAWGTLWTCAGGVASLVISVGLMKAFTSAIVGADVLAMAIFPLAVASGAAAWVILASLAGLPVSTTHALTGAIVGVALLAGGVASVSWGILLSGIAAPLALSPLVSAAIGFGTHAVARRISPACVCVREDISPGEVGADGTITGAFATRLVISTCTCASSGERVGDDAFGDRLSRRSLGAGGRILPAGMLHWGAAAALSFALVSAWIVTLPIAAAFAALAALALRAAP